MPLAGLIPVVVAGGIVTKFSDHMLGKKTKYRNPHRGAKRQRRLQRASPLGRSARPF